MTAIRHSVTIQLHTIMQSVTQTEKQIRPLQVRLGAELYRDVKVQAASEGMTLQEWVTDALRTKLARRKGRAA